MNSPDAKDTSHLLVGPPKSGLKRVASDPSMPKVSSQDLTASGHGRATGEIDKQLAEQLIQSAGKEEGGNEKWNVDVVDDESSELTDYPS